jgi:acyl carrier protein
MVPDREHPILEIVCAAINGAGWLGNISVLASDNLKDLGLSRLRLLATLIELEDEFDIEFPTHVDCFRTVGDIAVYIQSHATILYDDAD